MMANANSPEPEFPQPSEQCLFCKKEGVKGGGVGFVICDLFRYEFMQYKTVQFDEYSMCFKCGSVLNYVVYIKRLLLTTLFGLPLSPPIFTRELPEMSMSINENVRFILHSNMQNDIEFPVPNGRKNGLILSPHISIQDPSAQSHLSNSPLLLVTHSTDEEPANVGYHDYSDDGLHVRRTRSASRSESVRPKRPQSEPRTRSRKPDVSPERPKSQTSRRSSSQASQHLCKWLNCRLVCQSEKKLLMHYDEYHKFRCLPCKEVSFQSRSNLLLHKKKLHHNECKTCKMKFASDKIWAHRRSLHNCKCPYCDLKFHHHRDVRVHINSEHEGRLMLEWTYIKEIDNDDTEITSTLNYNKDRETEIIFLNNNNNNQTRAPSTSPKSQFLYVVRQPNSDSTNLADNITEIDKNTAEISNNITEINENIVESVIVQENIEELDKIDSSVEYGKSESTTEDKLNTIDQTAEILNVSEETSAKSTDEVCLEAPASDSCAAASLDSPNSQTFVSSKTNRQRKKRRLTPIVENDKLPQHCAVEIKLAASSPPKLDNTPVLDIPIKPHQDVNRESVRRVRKRKALPLHTVNVSPSKMNTRSRSRRQIAINDQNSTVSVQTTLDASAITETTSILQSPVEKLEQNITHTDENTADKNISSQIPKKRKKRVEKNTENLETSASITTKVNVNPIDDVIVHKQSADTEKESDAPSPTQDGASETLKKTLDAVENAISIDIDDKEANKPPPVQKTMITAASKKLFISEEKCPKIKLTSIDKLPEVCKELDGKVIPTKDEQAECTKNPAAPDTIVEQNAGENSQKMPMVVVEGHESSDSLSPWYIHEEGFSCGEVSPEAAAHNVPINAQKHRKSKIPAANRYNVILLNLDKVIESVVMAEDVKSCIENSPSNKISKLGSKNAKLTSKSNKSPDKKTAVEKSNKHTEVSLQSAVASVEAKATTSSDDLSSPLKATQNPDDEISAKYAKIAGSTMKSVAKYMLATTAATASSFKIKSTDFSSCNATDDPDHTDPTFTKLTLDKTTNSANVSVSVLSVGARKTNRRARNNIQKERSHRRATTFADFTGNIHCTSAEVPSIDSLADLKTVSKQVASDRIPKPDVYTFPETDNTEPGSSSHNITVDVKNTDSAGISKKAPKPKKNPENVEADQYGPIKKKRVKSKPKRNTAFDNAITEASQMYLRK